MDKTRNLQSYRSRLQDKAAAAKYSDRFESGSRKRVDQREQKAVKQIFSALPDVKVVLDVPCGAGRFAATLGAGGRKLIAIDVAEEVLEHARERAKKAGVKAEVLQGDASKLPLSNQAVDCAFSNRLLHHILDRKERLKIFAELHRVTRRFAVVSFFDYHSFGFVRKFLKAIKGRKPPYEGQPTFEQFTAEVNEAGFNVRQVVPTGAPWIAQKYFVLERR
ncbi:MAG: class I SAM-dependent methyltransferase [Verrucomicrobia bacterium]|nr:class I SAM-dependent methyltransferase [Verrucomicrobiota bacterium]